MLEKYNVVPDDYILLEELIQLSQPFKAGKPWQFAGSFYYATTVLTTIGRYSQHSMLSSGLLGNRSWRNQIAAFQQCGVSGAASVQLTEQSTKSSRTPLEWLKTCRMTSPRVSIGFAAKYKKWGSFFSQKRTSSMCKNRLRHRTCTGASRIQLFILLWRRFQSKCICWCWTRPRRTSTEQRSLSDCAGSTRQIAFWNGTNGEFTAWSLLRNHSITALEPFQAMERCVEKYIIAPPQWLTGKTRLSLEHCRHWVFRSIRTCVLQDVEGKSASFPRDTATIGERKQLICKCNKLILNFDGQYRIYLLHPVFTMDHQPTWND